MEDLWTPFDVPPEIVDDDGARLADALLRLYFTGTPRTSCLSRASISDLKFSTATVGVATGSRLCR